MSGNNASPEPGARDNRPGGGDTGSGSGGGSGSGTGSGSGSGSGRASGKGIGKGIGAAVGAAAIALAAAWFGLDGQSGGTGDSDGTDGAGSGESGRTGRAPAERTVSNQDDISAQSDTCPVDMLPAQADDVIDRILTNQDHIYSAHDGKHFGNYEGRLPRERGNYYREYTVDTPGLNHRGERRIIVGGGTEDDPDVWYYTDDHYETFCVIPDAED